MNPAAVEPASGTRRRRLRALARPRAARCARASCACSSTGRQLQPDPAAARPTCARAADGCLRGLPPCRASGGLAEVLRAARSQQRAGGGFEVAARRSTACPTGRRCRRRLRAPRPGRALAADQRRRPARLPRARAGARRARAPRGRRRCAGGAPWNEPNAPFFLSPQRARCDAAAPPRAPLVYTRSSAPCAPSCARRPATAGSSSATWPTSSRGAAGELGARGARRAPRRRRVLRRRRGAARLRRGRARRARGRGVVGAVERVLDRRPCARRHADLGHRGGRGRDARRRAPARRGGRPPGRLPGAAGRPAPLVGGPARHGRLPVHRPRRPAFPVGLADARLRRAWPAFAPAARLGRGPRARAGAAARRTPAPAAPEPSRSSGDPTPCGALARAGSPPSRGRAGRTDAAAAAPQTATGHVARPDPARPRRLGPPAAAPADLAAAAAANEATWARGHAPAERAALRRRARAVGRRPLRPPGRRRARRAVGRARAPVAPGHAGRASAPRSATRPTTSSPSTRPSTPTSPSSSGGRTSRCAPGRSCRCRRSTACASATGASPS